MVLLENTTVWRSGRTVSDYSSETNHCTFATDKESQKFNLSFSIDAAGGGTTDVRVSIGIEDLPSIFKEIANEFPEKVSVLSDCIAIANKKNLENLEVVRKTNHEVQLSISELTSVSEFTKKDMAQLVWLREQLNAIVSKLRNF